MPKSSHYLSTKLLLTLIVIITLVMALFLFIRTYRSYLEIDETLREDASIVATRIANAVRPTIWNIYQKSTERQFSEDVASAILDSELGSTSVLSIKVFGNFGHLFMGRIRLQSGEIIRYTESDYSQIKSTNPVIIRHPIIQSGITIGNVEVAMNTVRYQNFFKAGIMIDVLQLLTVGALIVLIVFVVVKRSLVRPLQEIQIAKNTLDTIDEGVVVVNAQGVVIDANPKFLALMAQKRDGFIHHTFDLTSLIHSSDTDPNEIIEHVLTQNVWKGELEIISKNGTVIPIWLNVSATLDQQQQLQATVYLFRDMTELQAKQNAMEHLAFHDTLTALPNRASFESRLKHDISIAKRLNKSLAVLFIDLDDFKSINDSLGHEMGDRLLKEIALRFEMRLRTSDSLARIGGDEFTVILTSFDGHQNYGAIGEELVALASNPVKLDNRELYVGASIGVAVYPENGVTVGELLKHADTAMYRAKEQGRNRICFYSTDQDEFSEARLVLEAGLRKAIELDQFELEYQPKINALSNQYTGFEALLRWKKEDGTYVPPLDFIPFAEERGLIIPIGRWVVQQALTQLGEWQKLLGKDISIAINVSPVQFYDNEFVHFLKTEVMKHNIAPNTLEIEITESTLIHDMEYSIKVLTELKQIGFKISMDDFGTGYSSLNYLKKLPIDFLKIDRSFIVDIDTSLKDQAITSAIVTLANNLNLVVIVEGVERQAQIDCLLEIGCSIFQGFFFSKPQKASDLLPTIEARLAHR